MAEIGSFVEEFHEEEDENEEEEGSDSADSNSETSSDDEDNGGDISEEVEDSDGENQQEVDIKKDSKRERDENNAELDIDFGDNDDINVNPSDCPICLMSLNGQQLGSPNQCDHVFCFLCISEWSKNSNTCPVDRTKFNYIEVSMTKKGPVIKKIRVEDKHVPNDQEWEQAPTYCEICNRCHREASMLLCDGCDKGYHLYCLVPPLRRVPEGDWYCDTCIVIRNENSLQRVDGSAVPDLVHELRTLTSSLPSTFPDPTVSSSRRRLPHSTHGQGHSRQSSGSTASKRGRSNSSRGRNVSRRGSRTTSKRTKTASTTRKRKSKRKGSRKRKTIKKSTMKQKTKKDQADNSPFQFPTIPGRSPRERLSSSLRASTSSDTGLGTRTALSILGDEFALYDFELDGAVATERRPASSSCSNNSQTSTDVLGSIFDGIEVLHDNDAHVSRDGRVVSSESPNQISLSKNESPDKSTPCKKPKLSSEQPDARSYVMSNVVIDSDKLRDASVDRSSQQMNRCRKEDVQHTTCKKSTTSPQKNHGGNVIGINSKMSNYISGEQPSPGPVLPADKPSFTLSLKRSPSTVYSVHSYRDAKTDTSLPSVHGESSSTRATWEEPCLREILDQNSSSISSQPTPAQSFGSQMQVCQQEAKSTIEGATSKTLSNTPIKRPTLSSRFSNQSTSNPVTTNNIASLLSGSRVTEVGEKHKELRVNVTSKGQEIPTKLSLPLPAAHPSLPKLKSSSEFVTKQLERPKLKGLCSSFYRPTNSTLDRTREDRPMNSNYEQTNQNLAIIDMLRNKRSTLKAEIRQDACPLNKEVPSKGGYSSLPSSFQHSDTSFHRPKLSSLLAPTCRSSSLPVAVVRPSTSCAAVDKKTDGPAWKPPQNVIQIMAGPMLSSLSYSQAPHCQRNMSATEAERLQNRRKGIARLQRLTSIKDTVRLVLQPFYNHHEISRTEFKDIFIRAVQKVNESNSDVNYHRIADLVKKYVKKYKGFRTHLADL